MPTNRRKFLVNTGIAATALLTAKSSKAFSKLDTWISAQQEKDNTIILLHTNDIGNQLHSVSGSKYDGMGGFYKTAEYITEVRKKYRHTILVDAGNNFSGHAHKQDEHAKTLNLMSRLKYDATLPGHRDIGNGIDYFADGLKKNNLHAVATNYKATDETILPYKIIRKGNLRIGIVGVGRKSHTENVFNNETVAEVSHVVGTLKQKGCHLVVCLSQLGYRNNNTLDDIKLAQLSENIDVIVGAYSGTFMMEPVIILNKNNEEVVINHAGHSGIMLGNIEISFDDKGNKKGIAFNNRFIGNKQEGAFVNQIS